MMPISTTPCLGVVGFAFVLNPDVGVKNLTRGELQDIFSGKTTNWKMIGGNDRKIVLIGRQIGTGTRFVFEDKVAKTQIPITIADNATAVVKAVATDLGIARVHRERLHRRPPESGR